MEISRCHGRFEYGPSPVEGTVRQSIPTVIFGLESLTIRVTLCDPAEIAKHHIARKQERLSSRTGILARSLGNINRFQQHRISHAIVVLSSVRSSSI